MTRSELNALRSRSVLISATLFIFAIFWTYLAIEFAPITKPILAGLYRPTEDSSVWVGYVTLASVSWTFAIWSFIRLSRKDRRDWTSAGLNKDLADVMTEKRGALSRFRILKTLESPQHRGHVSDATSIDWREVNREVELLRGFGLVNSLGKIGKTEMYGLTGKGRITLDLIQKRLNSEDTGTSPLSQESSAWW
jgi:hypothetical protein